MGNYKSPLILPAYKGIIASMDKVWKHNKYEAKIYSLWEKSGAFSPHQGKPYTILMPPPNANASLHAGHAMYTVEDILIRFKRMQGYSANWIPGTDHAGFETQYVYEKELSKKGKSRLDFDRNRLYQNIFKFVKDNSGLIYQQFKRLGFSANWKASVFTLDQPVIKRVFSTFEKMEKEGLIYRDDYIVNYCTNCGTSLAELEVIHIDRNDPLYYIKYPIVGSRKNITVATVRPETIFGDTAVCVNPKDKRYSKLVGQKVLLPLTKREIPIISDSMVDIKFATGAVKITPAHDPNDFEVSKNNKLEIVKVISLQGKIVMPDDATCQQLDGLNIKKAREETIKLLNKKKLIQKIDEKYTHSVTICYKCKRDLEPAVIPNWFIKVNKLKKPVIKAVEENKIHFFPKRFKRQMLTWLKIMHDWPISRQIVWGIRIPAWYSLQDNPDLNITFLDNKGLPINGKATNLLTKYNFNDIEKGLQSLVAPKNAKYIVSDSKPKGEYLQETDTFDTWFSSGQWPLVTIDLKDYHHLLPTDVMGTLSDILRFWISRMILFTLYLENTLPFKDVYLWSMVADEKGIKMSKSKGNVINPIDLVDKYGADALRFSLFYGIPAGGKAILSENKVRGMRNFANKLWNISRFVMSEKADKKFDKKKLTCPEDKDIINKLNTIIKDVTKSLDSYKINQAAETLYKFIWHEYADCYLEKCKTRRSDAQVVLEHVLKNCLLLLHPFMPFVTETIWQESQKRFGEGLLINEKWPN